MSHSHSHAHDSESHGQSQGRSHGGDFARANAEYFNVEAVNYDKPAAVDLHMKQLLPIWLKAYDFDPKATAVLDYACGTGLVSRGLAPHAAKLVGVDVSEGMIKQYNAKAQELGYSPEKMHAVTTSLNLDDTRFDVAICCMAYHHIEATAETTIKLVHFLKPGGVLLVVDQMPWVDEGTSNFEEVQHTIPHRHGFEETTMRQLFEGAGLTQFQYGEVTQFEWQGVTQHLFLARGVKA